MSVYLDSNATSQVHPEVVEAVLPFLTSHWHNPSSGYRAGQEVKSAVEVARGQVADMIGASPGEIVFTGCGTESNNMALEAAAKAAGSTAPVAISAIEHSAVYRPAEALAERDHLLTVIGVDEKGLIRRDEFDRMLDHSPPGVLSIMWANNETGVVQPMAELATRAKAAGWLVHTDAIQAAAKIPIDVKEVPVDYLSLSGHKFHAPKGVGALFIREGAPFSPLARGGGQEGGRRSGTENVAYDIGLGSACEIMRGELAGGGMDRVERLRNHLEESLSERIPDLHFNGARGHRTPNVAHVSFDGCSAADLLPLLDAEGVQCSAGSACMTGKNRPSHVQKAMGFDDRRAFSSLRLSLSIFSTRSDVDYAVGVLANVIAKVRSAVAVS